MPTALKMRQTTNINSSMQKISFYLVQISDGFNHTVLIIIITEVIKPITKCCQCEMVDTWLHRARP